MELQVHRCCCVMVMINGQEEQCSSQVIGNDNPFCKTCESRHPIYASSVGIEVTAKLPERGRQ